MFLTRLIIQISNNEQIPNPAFYFRWCLQEVVLQLRDGQRIEVYEPSVDDDEVKQEECFGQSAMATS